MAPELFGTKKGEVGLSTPESDTFALGMVTFEVRDTHCEESFHDFENPFCAFHQVFTGQLPFPENKAQGVIMKKIVVGERPSRPSGGKDCGLSDELWEVILSSLTPEAEKRPSASEFVRFLEKATPDIAVLEELTEFDANSAGHIQKIRHMFNYGDNTLLGMRKEETLVVIEVFDRVIHALHPP